MVGSAFRVENGSRSGKGWKADLWAAHPSLKEGHATWQRTARELGDCLTVGPGHRPLVGVTTPAGSDGRPVPVRAVFYGKDTLLNGRHCRTCGHEFSLWGRV